MMKSSLVLTLTCSSQSPAGIWLVEVVEVRGDGDVVLGETDQLLEDHTNSFRLKQLRHTVSRSIMMMMMILMI